MRSKHSVISAYRDGEEDIEGLFWRTSPNKMAYYCIPMLLYCPKFTVTGEVIADIDFMLMSHIS